MFVSEGKPDDIDWEGKELQLVILAEPAGNTGLSIKESKIVSANSVHQSVNRTKELSR